MSSGERPLGVTIIGILGILGGALLVLAGVGFAVLGAAFWGFIFREIEDIGIGSMLGAVGVGVGIFLTFIGLVSVFISWKFLQGRYWAWVLTLVLNGLSVVGSLPTILWPGGFGLFFLLPSILIPAIIIFYLLQPHVRAYFERKPKAPEAYYPPPPPPSSV